MKTVEKSVFRVQVRVRVPAAQQGFYQTRCSSGAEMSRYGLPYFCQTDKETTVGWKFPTRLYGSILHGEFASAFVFPAHLTGGSNVTIEVIHRSVQCSIVMSTRELLYFSVVESM